MFSEGRFQQLAAAALDALPEWVRLKMGNVEERSPRGGENLGLYEGVPLARRGTHYTALPDRITLYRSSIERLANDDDALRRLIARTLAHEVGHHFGISDDRLREI